MAKRLTLRRAGSDQGVGGLYFTTPSQDLEFFSTGCQILDCVLGGGFVLGRIANVVGDRSTGKTLLMIEASANFARSYPDGLIEYGEGEAAFDESYAQACGMPLDRVSFSGHQTKGDDPISGLDTVEQFYSALNKFIKRCRRKGVPGLYILDSLDALSDSGEIASDISDPSYGTAKARKMSEVFRRVKRELSQARVTLLIVSQVRSNIGVTFGRRYRRSGGKALDFYASQVIYLAQTGTIRRVIGGIERAVAVSILARTDKNKVGLPFRECAFDIVFGYGIDDVAASVDWLLSARGGEELGITKNSAKSFKQEARRDRSLARKLSKIVRRHWSAIERQFMPTDRKYDALGG